MDRSSLQPVLSHPALLAMRDALGDADGYLVGGAVRDLLLGRPLDDLDVAIDGELEPVLERLGVAGATTYERFGTATVTLEGTPVDLARTRRERYPEPGALPEVEPAPIRVDLARRDFTINALAVALGDEPEFLDPYDGAADLEAGLLRAIHRDSFRDDPTRALRAARYAAMLGFALEQRTAEWLAAADLTTVSDDRIRAELLRASAESVAPAIWRLLDQWGLIGLDADRLDLIERVAATLREPPWDGLTDRAEALTALGLAKDGELAALRALAELEPAAPSEGVAIAERHSDQELAIAREMGGAWIDEHVSRWRLLKPTVDGNDLLAEGIAEGPELGRALAAVRDGLLDGRIEPGRESELAAALAALGAD